MTQPWKIEPRWTDLDPAGHVNNSVYLIYAEEARARLLRNALAATWHSLIVVHNAIDYHHPVVQGDLLKVSTAVERIGTTSFTAISVVATERDRAQRCGLFRPSCATIAPPQDRGPPTNARFWRDCSCAARFRETAPRAHSCRC